MKRLKANARRPRVSSTLSRKCNVLLSAANPPVGRHFNNGGEQAKERGDQ
jgi:hypothetical protein